MVFAFEHAGRAGAALRLLGGAGIEAVCTPDRLVAVGEVARAEFRSVHRVEVAEQSAGRAIEVLTECGLLEQVVG